MFLVQIAEKMFIDAEKILSVFEDDEHLKVEVVGDEIGFTVGKKYRQSFLNYVQSINKNITNIEDCLNGR